MKTKNKFLALALMAMAMVIASCSKDNNDPVGPTQQEIETKIIGKWKLSQNAGSATLTNEKAVWTFTGGKNGTMSLSKYIPNINKWMWLNRVPTEYQVSDNQFTLATSMVKHYIDISSINDSEMNLSIEKSIANGGQTDDNATAQNCKFQKVTADYSKDIIGLWEGVSMTGDETYGNAEARIAYHADGTFTYYRKYAEVWFPSDDVSCEYNVDGDWLATRWCPEEGADYNYEWWDIDEIKDGTMKWSALRERADGSRYTTTFTWKKVNEYMDDALLAKAMGDWNNIGTTFYYFKDGEYVGKEEKLPIGEQTYSFYDGNKFRLIDTDDDGNPYVLMGGSCTVKGTIITSVVEEADWPELMGWEERYVIAILNDEYLGFAFFDEGESYVKGEDTPDHDQYLQLTRYKRK